MTDELRTAAAHMEAGGAGEIVVIALDELNIDYTYQRGLDHGFINRLAKSWDMAAAGAIKVGRRPDDSLWIVDGQHRAAAAKQAGETHILAQIVPDLDRAMEADLRLKGNDNRRDTVQEKFRAKLAAEQPEAKAIQKLLGEFDTAINFTPNQDEGVNAVSAVEAIYRIDQGVTLTRVLEFIRDTFGKVGGKQAGVASLKAITWFLDKHQPHEYDRKRLVERMDTVGIDEWDRKARSHQAAQRGALWVNYYRAMVEIYNHKLPESRALPWRLSGVSRGIGPNDTADRRNQASGN